MADNYNYGTLYAVSNSPLTAAMCSRIRQAMQKTNSWLSNYLLEAQVDPSLPSDYISLRAREYNICSPSSYLIRELPATKDSIDTTINILRFSIQDDPLSEIPTLFARERREPKMPRRRRVTTGNMPLRDIVCAARHAPEPCCYDESILAEERCYAQKEFEIEEEIDTEEEELTSKELEQREYLKKLRIMILDYISRYHTDPTQMLTEFVRGKYIIQPDHLSRLVVNNDLRIILPDFDEIEVTLYPLAKAIYFLFLLHPEGIVLKRIDKYRDELTMIYDLIMPNRNDDYSKACLNNIFDPLSGSLTQNISRIKRSFKLKILNEKIASNYYITGIRGNRYGISLDREKVQMPQVLL